jgi:hypothetical protein
MAKAVAIVRAWGGLYRESGRFRITKGMIIGKGANKE